MIVPLALADLATLAEEVGALEVGDLPLIRECLFRLAYPVDPATRAAWERLFQGPRAPDVKNTKASEPCSLSLSLS
jgi:hypothetical protein